MEAANNRTLDRYSFSKCTRADRRLLLYNLFVRLTTVNTNKNYINYLLQIVAVFR